MKNCKNCINSKFIPRGSYDGTTTYYLDKYVCEIGDITITPDGKFICDLYEPKQEYKWKAENNFRRVD